MNLIHYLCLYAVIRLSIYSFWSDALHQANATNVWIPMIIMTFIGWILINQTGNNYFSLVSYSPIRNMCHCVWKMWCFTLLFANLIEIWLQRMSSCCQPIREQHPISRSFTGWLESGYAKMAHNWGKTVLKVDILVNFNYTHCMFWKHRS